MEGGVGGRVKGDMKLEKRQKGKKWKEGRNRPMLEG